MNEQNQRHKRRYIAQALVWIVLLLAGLFMMPNISALVREKGQIKLPASANSQVAQVIQNHWGHHMDNTREVVVVFNNGNDKLSAQQKHRINTTISYLKAHKQRYHIKAMTAPNENKYTKKQLISKDKTTELLQLNVDKKEPVAQMREKLEQGAKTAGVKTYVTGADILQDDFDAETEEGIKKTELITIIFIFIVLAYVFRSPLTPIFSLLSVGISFLISLSVVMNLAKHFGFPLSNFTQVFMVVVLFGIGTDYNILLFDQFKEELSKGLDRVTATRNALKVAGHTILMSGSTVLIGFATLGLAKFSIYKSTLGVAVAVAVLLLALLTLNPFFMALLGQKIFWPTKQFNGSSKSKLWHWISSNAVKMPLLGLGVAVLCALPFLLSGSHPLNYDTLVELRDTLPAKEGFRVVQKHFTPGTAEPTTLYIRTNHRLDNEKDLREIDALAQRLQRVPGVKTVATVTEPGGGRIKQLYVKDQLGTITSGMKDARKGLNQISNGLNGAVAQMQGANLQGGIDGVNMLAAGSNQLLSGSEQLQAGANTLANGAGTLGNGLNLLNAQQGAIQNGTGQLVDSIGQLQNGASQVANGLSQVQQQVQSQLNPQQLSQLNSALNSMNSALNALNNMPDMGKVQQTAQSLEQNSNKAKNDAAALQQALGKMGGNGVDTNQVANQVAGAVSGLSPQQKQQLQGALQQAVGQMQQQNSGAVNDAKSAAQNLQNDMGNVQQAGNQLSSQLNTLKSASDQLNNLKQQASGMNVGAMQQQLNQLQSSASQLSNVLGQLQNGSAQVANGLNQLQNGASGMQNSLQQYTNGVASAAAGANQLENGAALLAAKQGELTAGLSTLNDGITQMATEMQGLIGQMQQLEYGLQTASAGAQKINDGVGAANSYLTGLKNSAAADTYYVPKNILTSKTYKTAEDSYLSADKKAVKFTIILDMNPSSLRAMHKVDELRAIVNQSVKGTPLAGATVALGGQSAKTNDTHKVAQNDFMRTAAIMLTGILLALMVITRSVLQPFYIVGTLLLAYVMSLDITRWISTVTMGHPMLTWNTPFFGFVVLIALGVDYSIFLMMRYREFDMGSATPAKRIVTAALEIGAVVISAATILSGTFAALIPSGVLTLIQVALVVIIGLIILVFAIPLIIPSLLRLTYPLTDRMEKEAEVVRRRKK